MRMGDFYPERLSWIRRKRGINKTTLGEKIGVDLRSISAYENGEYPPTQPNIERLARALRVSEAFFFMGSLSGPDPSQVSFRSFSKLTSAKRDMALGSATLAFLLCDWVSAKFELPPLQIPDLREIKNPEEAAFALRYQWGLGERPVSNMIHLLESKGVRVFSLALDVADVDACCTWHNDEPFVFLNTKKSNARRRFDAAHELGHLVLHRHGEYEGRITEIEADEFASAFLMPRDGFRSTAPRLVDLKNIIPNKSTWGVSVGAYIVRLHRLKMISDWHYRTLYKQISQRGYRRKEPFDHRPEMSKLAEMILSALRDEGISTRGISDQLGIDVSDINDLLFDIAIIGVSGERSGDVLKRDTDHLKLAVDNTRK